MSFISRIFKGSGDCAVNASGAEISIARSTTLQTTGLLHKSPDGGVLLGRCETRDGGFYLKDTSSDHIMVLGLARTGKGVGIVIPTLLGWRESVLVLDISGDNWTLTHNYREKVLGQRCLRFAPGQEDCVRFNPLDTIRLTEEKIIEDAENIAAMIVNPDGKGLSGHWVKASLDLMTGVILYILLDTRIRNKSLAGVAAFFSGDGEIREIIEGDKNGGSEMNGGQAVMQYVLKVARERCGGNFPDTPQGHAQKTGWFAVMRISQQMCNKALDEFYGVFSTAHSFLMIYRDPVIAENTSRSDFSIEDLMGRGFDKDGKPQGSGVSLYVVMFPHERNRIKPLVRLLVDLVCRRLASVEADVDPQRLLLLMDGFPDLGKLEILETTLPVMSEYNLKALLLAQSLEHIYRVYGGKGESILSWCNIRAGYGFIDVETARLFNRTAGKPGEECVQRLDGNEMVLMRDGAFFKARKLAYFEDAVLKARTEIDANHKHLSYSS